MGGGGQDACMGVVCVGGGGGGGYVGVDLKEGGHDVVVAGNERGDKRLLPAVAEQRHIPIGSSQGRGSCKTGGRRMGLTALLSCATCQQLQPECTARHDKSCRARIARSHALDATPPVCVCMQGSTAGLPFAALSLASGVTGSSRRECMKRTGHDERVEGARDRRQLQ